MAEGVSVESTSKFKAQLRSAIKDARLPKAAVTKMIIEGDWANLQILHGTARLLEEATKQSDQWKGEVTQLNEKLEERNQEITKLKEQLRLKEERERELQKENDLLRLKLLKVIKTEAAASARSRFISSRYPSPSHAAAPRSRYLHRGGRPPAAPAGHDNGDGVRLEAPPSVSRLPQSSISPYLDLYNVPWRRRKLRQKKKQPPKVQSQRSIAAVPKCRRNLPKSVRPVFKRSNGLKKPQVVGYRWRHFTEHPLLRERDPFDIPPNPFWKGGYEEDDDEEVGKQPPPQVRGVDEVDGEGEDDDDDCVVIEEGDEEDLKLGPKTTNAMTICKQENCMTTSRPYYVAEKSEDHMAVMLRDAALREGKVVEVPKWRVSVYKLRDDYDEDKEGQDMEEDTEDIFVLRRHARLELDEKRRKRWDSQRVREETYLEKLKRKMEEREKIRCQGRKAAAGRRSTATTGKLNVKGTVPLELGKDKGGDSDEEKEESKDLHGDILYIRVSEDIPISIFGHPMPIIEKREFDLPWISHFVQEGERGSPPSPSNSEEEIAISPEPQEDPDAGATPGSSHFSPSDASSWVRR